MKYYKIESIPEIRVRELLSRTKDSWEIFKFPKLFEIQKLQEALSSTLKTYELKLKDQNPRYKGICLQSAEGDQSPLFDQLDAIAYYDSQKRRIAVREFIENVNKITSVGRNFNFVLAPFQSLINLNRGRLLSATPGAILSRHTDGAHSATLHVPIVSQPHSHIVINENEYHLEADGSAYVVNTDLLHFMYNGGPEDRYHLVFNFSLTPEPSTI
jgi:hypothetical protein